MQNTQTWTLRDTEWTKLEHRIYIFDQDMRLKVVDVTLKPLLGSQLITFNAPPMLQYSAVVKFVKRHKIG